MRIVEAHVDIGHYGTGVKEYGKVLGAEACLRAHANIEYSIRGAEGAQCVEVGQTKFNMTITDFMKMQIGLSIKTASAPSAQPIRVLERWIVTFPNEATEDQCRFIAKSFMEKQIGDSEAVGRCAFHFKPGNYHGHMHWLDGLESHSSAKQRAAERDANRTDGKKTRVRRQNQLRFKELYHREPKTLGPEDPGVNMKSYLKQQWAEHVNACCLEFGIPVHFEHRSRKERGLPGRGTKHLGPQVCAMLQKVQDAEIVEMKTGQIQTINERALFAVERALSVVEENQRIINERESIQQAWSAAEYDMAAMIKEVGRHSLGEDLPVETNIIVASQQETPSKLPQTMADDLFDTARIEDLHDDILGRLGLESENYVNMPKAPFIPSLINEKPKKETPEQPPQNARRTRVNHEKGFHKATKSLSDALLNDDRRAAINSLARASYHCSGAYGLEGEDNKKPFIRKHLAEPARQLYDKFIFALSEIIRKRIFRQRPDSTKS